MLTHGDSRWLTTVKFYNVKNHNPLPYQHQSLNQFHVNHVSRAFWKSIKVGGNVLSGWMILKGRRNHYKKDSLSESHQMYFPKRRDPLHTLPCHSVKPGRYNWGEVVQQITWLQPCMALKIIPSTLNCILKRISCHKKGNICTNLNLCEKACHENCRDLSW